MIRAQLTLMTAFVVMWGSIHVAAAQEATPNATPHLSTSSCRELLPYWREVIEAYPGQRLDGQGEAMRVTAMSFEDMTLTGTAELEIAADYIDAYVANLETISHVPALVKEMHDAYVDRLVLLSRIISAQAEGRVMDAIALTSMAVSNDDRLRAEITLVADTCGDAWDTMPAVYRFMWDDWKV